MKSGCAQRGSGFVVVGLGFTPRGFAAMGLGFARCGSVFFFFFGGGFCSWSCSLVVVVSAMSCGRGLCSHWLLGMWCGLVSSSMVMVWVTNVILVLGVRFESVVLGLGSMVLLNLH